jgi:hypothetical protein
MYWRFKQVKQHTGGLIINAMALLGARGCFDTLVTRPVRADNCSICGV